MAHMCKCLGNNKNNKKTKKTKFQKASVEPWTYHSVDCRSGGLFFFVFVDTFCHPLRISVPDSFPALLETCLAAAARLGHTGCFSRACSETSRTSIDPRSTLDLLLGSQAQNMRLWPRIAELTLSAQFGQSTGCAPTCLRCSLPCQAHQCKKLQSLDWGSRIVDSPSGRTTWRDLVAAERPRSPEKRPEKRQRRPPTCDLEPEIDVSVFFDRPPLAAMGCQNHTPLHREAAALPSCVAGVASAVARDVCAGSRYVFDRHSVRFVPGRIVQIEGLERSCCPALWHPAAQFRVNRGRAREGVLEDFFRKHGYV